MFSLHGRNWTSRNDPGGRLVKRWRACVSIAFIGLGKDPSPASLGYYGAIPWEKPSIEDAKLAPFWDDVEWEKIDNSYATGYIILPEVGKVKVTWEKSGYELAQATKL